MEKIPLLQDFIEQVNLDKLLLHVHKPIRVHVHVKLEREKDKMLPHCVQLAKKVQAIVHEELETKFDSQEEQDSLMLCVRIVLSFSPTAARPVEDILPVQVRPS
jgi:hypothetical protein